MDEQLPAKKENPLTNLITFSSSDNLLSLTVHLDSDTDTVWLNLNQIAELFGRDKSVISRHLKKIFDSEELSKESVVAFFATTAVDGKTYNVEYFNLDAILAVGYRVNSKRGSEFRHWASHILKDYFIQGYVLNQEKFNLIGVNNLSRSLDLLKQTLLSHGYKDEIGYAAFDIIHSYSKSWFLLNAFDENRLTYHPHRHEEGSKFTRELCLESITQLKYELLQRKEASSLFGIQREQALDQILGSIHGPVARNC